MTSKRRREPKAEDEIVPSGLALQTAAGWLGITNIEAELANDGVNEVADQPRHKYQGLGAQDLPRSKAASLTAAAEHRLRSKLTKTAEAHRRQQGPPKQKESDTTMHSRESSDSEDVGRDAAFARGGKRGRVDLPSRAQMLAPVPTKAKRKRKKGGTSSSIAVVSPT